MTDSTNSVRQRVEDIWKTHSDGQGVNAIISLITEAETKAYNTGFDTGYKKGRAYGAALKETHEGDTK